MAAAGCARPTDVDKTRTDTAIQRAQSTTNIPDSCCSFGDRASGAEERLELASAVVVATTRQAALRDAQRAMALLALDRYEEARSAALASRDANAFGPGEELLAFVTIMEARGTLPAHARDDRPLLDAVDYYLTLRGAMLNAERARTATVAGARAAMGAAVLGDRLATAEAIDDTVALTGAVEVLGARELLLRCCAPRRRYRAGTDLSSRRQCARSALAAGRGKIISGGRCHSGRCRTRRTDRDRATRSTARTGHQHTNAGGARSWTCLSIRTRRANSVSATMRLRMWSRFARWPREMAKQRVQPSGGATTP